MFGKHYWCLMLQPFFSSLLLPEPSFRNWPASRGVNCDPVWGCQFHTSVWARKGEETQPRATRHEEEVSQEVLVKTHFICWQRRKIQWRLHVANKCLNDLNLKIVLFYKSHAVNPFKVYKSMVLISLQVCAAVTTVSFTMFLSFQE